MHGCFSFSGRDRRFLLAVFLGTFLFVLHADGADLTGTVTHVRDGDTVEVDGQAIRLNGLSAPEMDEPYGQRVQGLHETLGAGKGRWNAI